MPAQTLHQERQSIASSLLQPPVDSSNDDDGNGDSSSSTATTAAAAFRADRAELPISPSIFQRVIYPLQVLVCYLRRLSCAFGWRYVAAVTSVYGISQGLGEVYYDFAFDFFAADDLKITPARAAELYGYSLG